MSSVRKRLPVEEWTADKWYREFFSKCRLPEDDAESYAVLFSQNGMRSDMLQLLDKELLKEIKIVKVGHIIEILRAAQEASSQEQRSEIMHTTKGPLSTLPSKVVNLKSVVNPKDSRTRRESDVGGSKRDTTSLKRPVPDEGPTLSVKMPAKMKPVLPNNSEDECMSVLRAGIKERTSAQSVEVSSSTEKKQKKSVFDRLGSVTTSAAQPSPSGKPLVQSSVQAIPSSGILKKPQSSQNQKSTIKYGPALGRSTSPKETRRCQSPGRLVINSPNVGPSMLPNQIFRSASPYRQRSLSPKQAASNSKASSSIEPSVRVTMSMKLSNPLVTKVTNGPLNKKQLERRSSNLSYSRSTSNIFSASDKQYYGSMAADQVEMSKDLGLDRGMKQRLGNRPISWNKMETSTEKKRVSFGNVRTQEIPAVAGTQRLNPSPSNLCRQIYSGSVALRTAKKL